MSRVSTLCHDLLLSQDGDEVFNQRRATPWS